jgi:hypothetical protein
VPLVILFTIVVLLSLIACDEEPFEHSENWPVISGLITDSITSVPIDSAIIMVEDIGVGNIGPWYSDSTGHYIIVKVGTDLRLIISKEGYLTQTRYLGNVESDIENVDFKLIQQ